MRIPHPALSGLKVASERLLVLLAAVALLTPLACAPAADGEDPFLWLEEVEGERAMEWVLAQNELTRAELKALPEYQELFDNTLEILTSTARIAYPSIQGDMLFNFWTDGDHPRGIYRRTTWNSSAESRGGWWSCIWMPWGRKWALRGGSGG